MILERDLGRGYGHLPVVGAEDDDHVGGERRAQLQRWWDLLLEMEASWRRASEQDLVNPSSVVLGLDRLLLTPRGECITSPGCPFADDEKRRIVVC